MECQCVIQSGPRTGQHCNAKIKKGKTCGRHIRTCLSSVVPRKRLMKKKSPAKVKSPKLQNIAKVSSMKIPSPIRYKSPTAKIAQIHSPVKVERQLRAIDMKMKSPVKVKRGVVVRQLSPAKVRQGVVVRQLSPAKVRQGVVVRQLSPAKVKQGVVVRQRSPSAASQSPKYDYEYDYGYNKPYYFPAGSRSKSKSKRKPTRAQRLKAALLGAGIVGASLFGGGQETAAPRQLQYDYQQRLEGGEGAFDMTNRMRPIQWPPVNPQDELPNRAPQPFNFDLDEM